jgi:hypothetical protein
MVNSKDLDGEYQRAYENDKVGTLYRKVTAYAKKVKADDRYNDADPYVYRRASFERYRVYRYEHDVKRGDKRGLAGIGAGGHSKLLKEGRRNEHRAAYRAADKLACVEVGRPAFFEKKATRVTYFIKYGYQSKQKNACNKASYGTKRKWRHRLRCLLRRKGKAPYHSR